MRRRSASPYLFLAFPVAILTVFTVGPTLLGLGLGFFDWSGSGPARFVGLGNYRSLVNDSRFWPALRNTLVFVLLSVPPSVFAGFLLATIVQARWFVGRTLVRTALFLPTVVSIIAVGVVWRWLLDSAGGLLPRTIVGVGFERSPDFLQGGPIVPWLPWLSWPMVSLIVIQVWRTAGYCMVLYLAALSGVNESLYEAAEVDGATRVGVLRNVTWPEVAPMTAFLMVTGVIGGLQVFDIVWAMTSATETDSTVTLNLYIFREFQQSRLGYSAAIGGVLFALTLVATMLQLRVMRRNAA